MPPWAGVVFVGRSKDGNDKLLYTLLNTMRALQIQKIQRYKLMFGHRFNLEVHPAQLSNPILLLQLGKIH